MVTSKEALNDSLVFLRFPYPLQKTGVFRFIYTELSTLFTVGGRFLQAGLIICQEKDGD